MTGQSYTVTSTVWDCTKPCGCGFCAGWACDEGKAEMGRGGGGSVAAGNSQTPKDSGQLGRHACAALSISPSRRSGCSPPCSPLEICDGKV